MPLLRNPLSPGGRSESRPLNVPGHSSSASAADRPSSGDRILVIAPSWVGDAILSEPLIAKLLARGIPAPIDVIAPSWCGPVYARMRGVGRIIDSPAGHGAFALRDRRALGIALRGERYSHAYVLPNTWKSALVPWFAKIPHRIGYRGEARYGLLTEARRVDRKVPQLVARYAALAEPLATLGAEPTPPVLVPDSRNLQAAIRGMGLSQQSPVAILCPGAEYGPAKRWPIEHFATLGQQLLAEGYAIWILGSPKDAPIGSQITSALKSSPRVFDLCGRTDLGTAIDLMAAATIVISNDSGLMHAAAAVRAPLVALFGSSSPAYTPPLSDTARVARIEISCSPCFQRECPLGHFRCMRDLSPELVYNLARTTSSPPSSATPR